MEPLTFFFRKLQMLFRRGQFNQEFAEEMAFHREQVESELREEGMSEEVAHFAAVRRVGNETQLREQAQDVFSFRFETRFSTICITHADSSAKIPPIAQPSS
jgi:hypothetical protein